MIFVQNSLEPRNERTTHQNICFLISSKILFTETHHFKSPIKLTVLRCFLDSFPPFWPTTILCRNRVLFLSLTPGTLVKMKSESIRTSIKTSVSVCHLFLRERTKVINGYLFFWHLHKSFDIVSTLNVQKSSSSWGWSDNNNVIYYFVVNLFEIIVLNLTSP